MRPEADEITDYFKRGLIQHLTTPKPEGHGMSVREDENSDLREVMYEGLKAMHTLEHEHFEHGHKHIDMPA